MSSLGRLVVVEHDAQHGRLDAQLLALGPQRVAVGVADLARAAAAWSTSTSSLPVEMMATRGRRWTCTVGMTEAGDQPDLGRTKHAARLEHPVAGRHVLTGLADVLAPLARARR